MFVKTYLLNFPHRFRVQLFLIRNKIHQIVLDEFITLQYIMVSGTCKNRFSFISRTTKQQSKRKKMSIFVGFPIAKLSKIV